MSIFKCVNPDYIKLAKQQIEEFRKTSKGKFKYSGVNSWRGIVAEFIVSDWLNTITNVDIHSKGVDTSGKYDDYDILVNNLKVEVKCATEYYHKFITPKVKLVTDKPKDIYIGCKYHSRSKSYDEVEIIGFTEVKFIKNCNISQMHGAAYYEVPLSDLIPIEKLQPYLNSLR
ncbi:MAG: hypothetical protein ACLTUN_01290 [Paraclostridium sordellii]